VDRLVELQEKAELKEDKNIDEFVSRYLSNHSVEEPVVEEISRRKITKLLAIGILGILLADPTSKYIHKRDVRSKINDVEKANENKLTEAIKQYSETLVVHAYKSNPGNPRFSYQVGDFYWRKGDMDKARFFYKRGLDQRGSEEFGKYSLACIDLVLGLEYQEWCNRGFWGTTKGINYFLNKSLREKALKSFEGILDLNFSGNMKSDIVSKIKIAEYGHIESIDRFKEKIAYNSNKINTNFRGKRR